MNIKDYHFKGPYFYNLKLRTYVTSFTDILLLAATVINEPFKRLQESGCGWCNEKLSPGFRFTANYFCLRKNLAGRQSAIITTTIEVAKGSLKT